MQVRAKKYLHDIVHAGRLLLDFLGERDFASFEGDPQLRAAVEREFGIIGEAMVRLAREQPEVAGRISEYRDIIAFRNLLIHAYSAVEASAVWTAVHDDLPVLMREAEALLTEPED
ncbi:MAG: HepT-like ribonuclease domain-containing protein [Terriglobales bacterium]